MVRNEGRGFEKIAKTLDVSVNSYIFISAFFVAGRQSISERASVRRLRACVNRLAIFTLGTCLRDQAASSLPIDTSTTRLLARPLSRSE